MARRSEKVILSFLIALISTVGQLVAQDRKSCLISGKILDKSDGAALPGGYIRLKKIGIATVSDLSGNFVLNADFENVFLDTLQIRFVGYQSLDIPISLIVGETQLGNIILFPEIRALDGVTVEATKSIVRKKGDTLSFQTSTLQVNDEAKGLDLLKKLPLIKVGKNKVEAEGEQVKKVYLNGKPFYDDDPKAALNALPADAIQSVELFDDYGEVATFTGYAGGNSSKAINIITKPDVSGQWLGQYRIGAGPDGHYIFEGNTSRISDRRSLTITAERNNLNESQTDIADFRSLQQVIEEKVAGSSSPESEMAGDNDIRTFGLNYNTLIGRKTEVSINYTSGNIDSELKRESLRNYADSVFFGTKDTLGSETNIHKLKLKVTHNLNPENRLILAQRFTFRNVESESSERSEGNGNSEAFTNLSNTSLSSSNNSLKSNTTLIWLRKIGDDGKSFTALANMRLGADNQERDFEINTTRLSATPEGGLKQISEEKLRQIDDLGMSDNQATIRLSYKLPVGMLSNLNFVYKYDYSWRDALQESFPEDLSVGFSSTPDLDISADSYSRIHTNRGEIGVSRFGLHLLYNIGLAYEHTAYSFGDVIDPELNYKKKYGKVLPTLFGKYFIDLDRNLTFFFRGNTTVPTPEQVLPAADRSDPTNIYAGNPELELGTQYLGMLRYNQILDEGGRFLSAFTFFKYGYNFTGLRTDFLTEKTMIHGVELKAGTQLTTPVNLDGSINLKVGTDYSFALQGLKSRLNTGLRYEYSRMPTVFNGDSLNTHLNTMSLSFGIASDISKRIDFNISAYTGYNLTNNSLNDNSNDFFSQQLVFEGHFRPWNRLVLDLDYTWNQYFYSDPHLDTEVHLLSLSIGSTLFKNRKGTLKIRVYDVLDQNNLIDYKIHETHTETSETNAMTRNVTLVFGYKL
ncbi:hypothetical protein FUAX_47830 (plasmid) [Fulvitalea axinellae]|uniref:TonB-dependent receptor n=1 Tax=Fulvitalea axinellae TaxID=1182444 RepID=A0AAU9CJR0_9BACT|nr:hypothetical protein FUAX_47830 [Fulvitalea axinellae]